MTQKYTHTTYQQMALMEESDNIGIRTPS